MSKIKFGLKLWSVDRVLLNQAEELIERKIFDYVELLVVPKTEITPFFNCKLPYIIHIVHDAFGLNISDQQKRKSNLEMIKESFVWAKNLKAKHLILHPGFGKIEDAEEFLKEVKGKNILIENMPKVGLNGEKMIGFSPQQMKVLQDKRFGFCLDVGHAIGSAISQKIDYKKYLKNFLSLKPKVLHICDGNLDSEIDQHLNLGSGQFDWQFIAEEIIPKVPLITLETPRNNLKSLDEDVVNIRFLREFLNK
jgi:deoxyribonuclease-4